MKYNADFTQKNLSIWLGIPAIEKLQNLFCHIQFCQCSRNTPYMQKALKLTT